MKPISGSTASSFYQPRDFKAEDRADLPDASVADVRDGMSTKLGRAFKLATDGGATYDAFVVENKKSESGEEFFASSSAIKGYLFRGAMNFFDASGVQRPLNVYRNFKVSQSSVHFSPGSDYEKMASLVKDEKSVDGRWRRLTVAAALPTRDETGAGAWLGIPKPSELAKDSEVLIRSGTSKLRVTFLSVVNDDRVLVSRDMSISPLGPGSELISQDEGHAIYKINKSALLKQLDTSVLAPPAAGGATVPAVVAAPDETSVSQAGPVPPAPRGTQQKSQGFWK